MMNFLLGVGGIIYLSDKIEAILKDMGLAHQIYTLEDIGVLGAGVVLKSFATDQKLVYVVDIP
jgi:hypothetical protein